jgi:hypothetical protein
MNRDPDLDQTLVAWLDEGADQAPERFVWAAMEDVERTAQRGAWRASTEELFMQFKHVTPILGVAAAVVLAIVAYQMFGTGIGGGPAPRVFTSDDLPTIVMTEENALEDMTLVRTATAQAALREPLPGGMRNIETTGFIDALLTEVSSPQGGYVTWAAVFETEEDAERAFDYIVDAHEAPEGWGLGGSALDPALGDEGKDWTGQQYDFERARTIFWRENNLLLAAVGWIDWDADYLRSISNTMDARAD